MSIKFVQCDPFSLAGAGAIIGATSITLKSFQTIDGVNLLMTDFGTEGFMTLEPGNGALEEQISFAGVTQNANGTATLTTVKSVLFVSPYTETSGLLKTHAGSTTAIVSNTAGFYNQFANTANNQTFAGIITFTQSPIVPTGGTGTQAANADDIANAITGFTGTASPTVAGTVKTTTANIIVVSTDDTRVPTQGENNALVGDNTDIAVGSGNTFVTQTGLIHNAEKYAADTSGSTTAYAIALSPIVTSLTTGMEVYAKIISANTTTTPTLNVNGLGAKTIVKGVNTPLLIGDIGANQFVTFIYDATNTVWVLQNTTANSIVSSGLVEYIASDNLLISENGVVSVGNATAIARSIRVNRAGTYRIKLDYASDFGGGVVSGTIVKTDSIGSINVGSGWSTSSLVYASYSQDLYFEAGTAIEVSLTGALGVNSLAKNFGIYGDIAVQPVFDIIL